MDSIVHAVVKSCTQLNDFHFHSGEECTVWNKTDLVLILALPFILQDVPVAQIVKNLPATQETSVQSLCLEDPLEKGTAILSGILAWRIPQRNLAGYSLQGHKELDMTE